MFGFLKYFVYIYIIGNDIACYCMDDALNAAYFNCILYFLLILFPQDLTVAM
jgi:hypothetical protein